MKRALLAAAAAAACIAAAPAPAQTAEETAIMDRVEAAVILPKAQHPLADYNRSFAWLGDHTVIAIFLAPEMNEPAGRHWVPGKELPRIYDGGCMIVTVFYDAKAGKITGTMCNNAL